MQEAAVSLLAAWQNFYVIIGSAAVALTGLMFVVITLIMGTQGKRSNDSIGAFGTPTVVHLCSAFLIAVLLSAPWPELWEAAILLGLSGLAGVIYFVIVTRRALRQTTYEPVLEDWLWYIIFPFLAYAVLLLAALLLFNNPVPALFIIAAISVAFLFIGIHNAWDTVTYVVIENATRENELGR